MTERLNHNSELPQTDLGLNNQVLENQSDLPNKLSLEAAIDGTPVIADLRPIDRITPLASREEEYQETLNRLGRVNPPESKPQNPIARRVKAFAAAVLLTGTGMALNPSEVKAESKTPTKMVTKGFLASDQAVANFGLRADAGASDVIVVSETSASDSETGQSVLDIVTPEYRAETLAIIRDLEAPLPIERINNIWQAWKIENFGPYEQELRSLGVTDETRIKDVSRLLYAYDNSRGFVAPIDDKFQNYVSRQALIDYALTGKSKDVLFDPEGNFVLWQVNLTDKMKKGFKAGIKQLEKDGFGDVYASLRDSGVCVLFAAELQPDRMPSNCLINEWGVVNMNMSQANTKGMDISRLFMLQLPVEPVGVSMWQLTQALGVYGSRLGATGLSNLEVVKDSMAEEIVRCLGNRKPYAGYASNYAREANMYAQMLGVMVDDPWVQRQKDLVYAMFEVIGEDLLNKDN